MLPEQPGFWANAYDRGVTLAGRGETNPIHFEEFKWANASNVRDADPKNKTKQKKKSPLLFLNWKLLRTQRATIKKILTLFWSHFC